MTAIVGIEGDGEAILVGDTLLSGDNQRVYIDTKLVGFDGGALGFAGDARIDQVLRLYHKLEPYEGGDPEEWIVRKLLPPLSLAMKTAQEQTRLLTDKDDTRQPVHAEIIAAVGGQIWCVDCYHYAYRSTRGYAAIGCGQEFALGALAVLAHSDAPPLERAKQAVLAAAEHCPGVGGPLTQAIVPAKPPTKRKRKGQ